MRCVIGLTMTLLVAGCGASSRQSPCEFPVIQIPPTFPYAKFGDDKAAHSEAIDQIQQCMGEVEFNGTRQRLYLWKIVTIGETSYLQYLLPSVTDVEYVFLEHDKKVTGYFIE